MCSVIWLSRKLLVKVVVMVLHEKVGIKEIFPLLSSDFLQNFINRH